MIPFEWLIFENSSSKIARYKNETCVEKNKPSSNILSFFWTNFIKNSAKIWTEILTTSLLHCFDYFQRKWWKFCARGGFFSRQFLTSKLVFFTELFFIIQKIVFSTSYGGLKIANLDDLKHLTRNIIGAFGA